jgi:hypothetical protein
MSVRHSQLLAKALIPAFGLWVFTANAGAPPAPPPAPQAAAPFDVTGYWISVVSEDWVYRMLTPAKGDFSSGVPLNAEARRVAGEWDIEKDKAAGEACRPFGAAGVMRQPGRLHLTWSDEQTLKMEIEAGTQTRLLSFIPGTAGAPGWQGSSTAVWQKQRQARGMGGGGPAPFLDPTQAGKGGTLEVVTKNLRPGYLMKNGVPYSENTKMTEYFDVVSFPDGTPWLIVTTIIEDPKYLVQPYLLSTHFRKEKEPVKWSPRPCETRPPLTDKPPRPGQR